MITRRRASSMVLATVWVLATAAAAGCGAPANEAARDAASAPAPASTRAAEADRPARAARAQRVLLPPAALAPLRLTVAPEERLDYRDQSAGGSKTSQYCDRWVEDQGSVLTHVMHQRSWIESGRYVVFNKAHGYGQITAAHAVDTTRRNAGLCQRHVIRFSADRKVEHELLDVVDPGTLAGVDAHYGRCARTTGVGSADPPVYMCAVFLARGDLLSNIEVWSPASVDAARTGLLSLIPAAAAALTAA